MAEITVHYEGPLVTRPEARREGLKYYFTGKPCFWGHIQQRYVSSTICLTCQQEKRPPQSSIPCDPVPPVVFYDGTLISRLDAEASGLDRYFDGRPCKRGHIGQRRVVNNRCVVCRALSHKTDRAKIVQRAYNRSDRGKARQRAYDLRRQEARRAWEQSASVKALRHQYAISERGRETRRAYSKTEGYQRALTKYNNSAGRKKARLSYQRTRRALKRGASAGVFTRADEIRLRQEQTRCHSSVNYRNDEQARY